MHSQSSQIIEYVPVLILGIFVLIFAIGTLIASVIFGKRGKSNPTKNSAYECGMLPVGKGNARFSVKFYLVAMLFILFDVEVVFLYPWAVIYKEQLAANPHEILISMMVFLGLFAVGFVYEVKKKAFDWKE